MKNSWKISLILLLFVAGFLAASCGNSQAQTGLLQGGVTIGPLTPVEIPGQDLPVPPEVFSSRKILVYDATGEKLIKEVAINQIDQTANGYYGVLLEPGTYTVDLDNTSIGGANLPKKITISPGKTVILDIDIDTGIR